MRLECNQFSDNAQPNLVQNKANVVMNDYFTGYARNLLSAYSTPVNCAISNAPLMVITSSTPALSSGYNTFNFDVDGTYIKRNQSSPSISITNNYFSPNDNAPAQGNSHFCPNTAFSGTPAPNPLSSCMEGNLTGLGESQALFQQAATESKPPASRSQVRRTAPL